MLSYNLSDSLIISKISRKRLDISILVSTKKKPVTKYPAYLLSDRRPLARRNPPDAIYSSPISHELTTIASLLSQRGIKQNL